MAKLIIRQGDHFQEITYTPPLALRRALEMHGVNIIHPCGGRGTCGKCAVSLSGEVSPPNGLEIRAGTRLSCQAVLLGDAEVIMPKAQGDMEIEGSAISVTVQESQETGIGAAIDIGTTTIAATLYDLKDGKVLAQRGMLNPQTQIAADVMGRIGAALQGDQEKLKSLVSNALAELTKGFSMKRMVITGNTTMFYLITGRNVDCLSHAPFHADDLFGRMIDFMGTPSYLPRCMNAFVGADITCAVLASGMCRHSAPALLCDIGTNGEIALWKDEKLYVTSTAAGPAFEGAGISCGCGSIPGAIDRVFIKDGHVSIHTIGDQKAVGLCGSGLIDTIAALLATGDIDETGSMEDDNFPLADGILLLPQDVRAVQLAKAAIAAGIKTLLEAAHASDDQIETLYIAGGFGSHLNVDSAARIGLIPASLSQKVRVIGNAALTGAAQLLMNQSFIDEADHIARQSIHINLGGNASFNEHYMEEMMFPEED